MQLQRHLQLSRLSLVVLALGASGCTFTANLDDLKGGAPVTDGGTTVDADAGGDTTTTPAAPMLPLKVVVAGGQHACVIDGTDDLFCWGANYAGQLGNGKTGGKEAFFVKAQVPEKVSAAACGGQHTCAVGKSGTLYCWGAGASGALGNGDTDVNVPTAVAGVSDVSKVTAGANHTCAIASAALWCWGSNSEGQLGTGAASSTPAKVPLTNVTVAAAGGQHTCAVANGEVSCWGSNVFGQVGSAQVGTDAPTAVGVPSGFAPASVSAGGKHSCARDSDDKVVCWGNNQEGQLGIGSTSQQELPTALSGYSASGISLGEEHSCGIAAGVISCWGASDRGQVGVGSGSSFDSPTQLILTQVQSVATGTRFSCAIAANGGALWCWGDNTSSQLGADLSTSSEAQPHKLPLTQ